MNSIDLNSSRNSSPNRSQNHFVLAQLLSFIRPQFRSKPNKEYTYIIKMDNLDLNQDQNNHSGLSHSCFDLDGDFEVYLTSI